MQYKTIYSSSYPSNQLEFQEAILTGWRIDENFLPHADYIGYRIDLVKVDVVQDALLTSEAEHNTFGNVQVPVKRVGRQAKGAQ